MLIIELLTGRSVGISCTSKYLGIGSKTHDLTFLFEGGTKMVTQRVYILFSRFDWFMVQNQCF